MTSTAPTATHTAAGADDTQRDHRWAVLAVVGVAQLMVVLDTTIVNIALPSAQADLGFSTTSRQWVVTAYALAFGSLLLLGGRLSDLVGRRRTLLVGLLGFAAASAIGGAAPSFDLLVAARALQGVFAAVLAPAALSALNVTFTDARERARAFGVYAAIAAGGSVVGLVAGGMLTEWLSWRWCLYVNLAFAVPAAFGVLRYLPGHERRGRSGIDVPGAVTVAGGLFCLVYGLSNAEQHGWGAALTVGMLVASGVLLAAFVLVERAVADPLLPLAVLGDRTRAGSYLSVAVVFTAMFGTFLFLTYYLQRGLGFSPLVTGLAFLPLSAGIAAASGLANTRLAPRFGPRPLVPTGMVVAAGALVWLAQLGTGSTYGADVVGPMIVLGLGVGLAFAPAISAATAGLHAGAAGVGSAMVNTSQQIGGAIGTAVLSTVFSSALDRYLGSHRPGPGLQAAASTHGYTVAFAVDAGILLGGAVLAALLLRSGPVSAPEGAPAVAA